MVDFFFEGCLNFIYRLKDTPTPTHTYHSQTWPTPTISRWIILAFSVLNDMEPTVVPPGLHFSCYYFPAYREGLLIR